MDERQNELTPQLRAIPTRLRAEAPAASSGQHYALPNQQQQAQPLEMLVRIFFSHRPLILCISMLVIVVGMLYAFLATRKYTAETKLKIGTYAPILPSADLEDIIRQQTREQDYVQTQIELLSSYAVVDKVMSDSELSGVLADYFARESRFSRLQKKVFGFLRLRSARKEGEAKPTHYRASPEQLENYLGLIKVTPIRKTSLVRIAATTSDSQLSAKIANSHGAAFIEYMRQDRQKTSLDTLAFLNQQAEELAQKIAASERKMAAYAEDNSIVNLDNDENIVMRKMAELNDLLTQATARRIASESAFNEAKSGSGVESTALDDDSIRDLRTKLKQAESEYAMLSEKFTPSYPRMGQLKAQVEDLKKNLIEQRNQALKALEGKYRAEVESEEQLKKQVEDQKVKAFELSRREVQFNIMKREYDSLKDLYQSVLRQVKEAQMSSESPGSNVAISEYAVAPINPSSPKRLLITIAAFILGPLAGFLLGLLSELMDNTLKTVEEARDVLQVGMLGIVPRYGIAASEKKEMARASSQTKQSAENRPVVDIDFPAGGPLAGDSLWTLQTPSVQVALPKARRRSTSTITVLTPSSVTSEAFRTVRTALMLSTAEHPPRVILITSPKKGDGKTTLVSNLGVTLAQSPAKTLIVEADVRRPSVSRYFGIDSVTSGLVDYLTGCRSLEQIIQQTSVENLWVLPSGPKPPNPGELVGSRRMSEMLTLLAGRFDFVLVDAPPILPVADAVVLSNYVDGVVLVLRNRGTQRSAAQEAAERLRQVGARILGFVFNDVDLRRGYHSYRYRDSYHEYYDEDSQEGNALLSMLSKLRGTRRDSF